MSSLHVFINAASVTSLVYYNVGPPLNTKALSLLKWKDSQGQEKEFRLVNQVSAKWREFGRLLNINLNQLNEIEEDQTKTTERWWKVIELWLNGRECEYERTWEGLYSLLDDLQLPKIAKDLKEAVTENRS